MKKSQLLCRKDTYLSQLLQIFSKKVLYTLKREYLKTKHLCHVRFFCFYTLSIPLIFSKLYFDV